MGGDQMESPTTVNPVSAADAPDSIRGGARRARPRQRPRRPTPTSCRPLAKRHLWMHFSRMGSYVDHHRFP